MNSIYNPESVKDVAESLGISGLGDDLAKALAMDVEYRIHEVIQEAQKFMRHSRRTTLRTSDISHALRVLNVEPLYGFAANNPIRFKEAPLAPNQPPLYYIEDEELEFEKIINAPLPKVPRDVSYTAHWLAIEGIQPAIPQNPAPSEARPDYGAKPGASTTNAEVEVKPLVKHVLSKELLLYFERITTAVMDERNETLRTAAIASLRNDPGLHQLLPYFVQFVSEKVTHNLKNIFVLNMMMQVSWSILDNPNLFVEPYIHQMMPPILTCLVAKKLGDVPGSTEHYDLRDLAASILGQLCNRFSEVYHTLKPRVTKTLLKAYLDDKKPFTTHYGAIIGLTKMGREVVRVLILPNAKIYEILLKPELKQDTDKTRKVEAERCLQALIMALDTIRDEELPVTSLDAPSSKTESEVQKILKERVGDLLTEYIISQKDEMIVKAQEFLQIIIDERAL